MTRSVQNLLTQGNLKLGESIHVWSLPATPKVCIGATPTCSRVCYAKKSRFLFDAVKERFAWNLEQAKRADFSERLIREVKMKGCLVIRIHAAGDFFDEVYARKWLTVMKQCPKTRFYFYTRSWRCESVEPVFREMAALRCCRAWYSIDVDTGVPAFIPPGVRLAFLQAEEDETPELADLTFRRRGLRKEPRVGLPMVCPSETPLGRSNHVNCGSCQKCWG